MALKNNLLTDNDIENLFEDEDFWNDQENTIQAPLPSEIDNILILNDQSDQEEEDNEISSDHDTESEFSWSSGDDSNFDQDEEIIEMPPSGSTSKKGKTPGYWHGKDKTIWSKQEPTRSRTTSENIIKILPGLAGEARQNPPKNALEAWNLLFTDNMIQIIVEFTNKKIRTMSANYTVSAKNRISFLSITTSEEIRAFIGLLYLQGIFKSNHENLRSLWATDGTGRDIFHCTMTLARFNFLLSTLRFDDEATRAERRAITKLAPIKDLFEEFVQRSRKNYIPGEFLTVDEMLVAFRGRCGFRMYMPNKPAKYGIKLQILADSKTHYMCNAEVYLGRDNGPVQQSAFLQPTQVVLRLITSLPKKSNRNITGDNWYSSVELVNELLKNNLTYVGTMKKKKNKRQIPPEFQASRSRPESSSLFGFQSKTTMVSHVPKKGKSVILISSMHHDAKIDKNTLKPDIILFYNDTKSGVDALDQKCVHFSTSRRTRRWPMVLFFQMLNIAGVNSRVLYQCSPKGTEIERYSFLKKLGMALCKDYMEIRMNNKYIRRQLRESIALRLGTSLPVDPTPVPEQSRSKRKRCAFCPAKKDRKTSASCKKCNKPICFSCGKMLCVPCINK